MSDNTDYALPNIFYAASLIVVSLFQIRLFNIALRPENRFPEVTEGQVAAIRRRSWSVPMAATIAILCCAASPPLSMLAFLAVPIFVRVLGRERLFRRG